MKVNIVFIIDLERKMNKHTEFKHIKRSIDLNGKTILVTGSPGFIGANLVL